MDENHCHVEAGRDGCLLDGRSRNYRITLDIYVGTTSGVLDRAREATE